MLYQGRFKGGKVFLENNGFTYLFYPTNGIEQLHHKINDPDGFNETLDFHAVKLEFVNSNLHTIKQEKDSNAYYENYYLDQDPGKWKIRVKSYKQIIYKDFYSNIDLSVLSNKHHFRFDLVLKPNSTLDQIEFKIKGANHLRLIENKLVFSTSVGLMEFQAPVAFQEINGRKKYYQCSYELKEGIVSFKLEENYDKSLPIIIDPTLVFATYTGSLSDNFGMTATYDLSGNAYTAGVCFGPSYPTTPGAFQLTYMGPNGANHGTDISISKFSPNGSALLYSTYLGGSHWEAPQSIVVDNNNNLVVFGRSASTDFPVTPGTFQTTIGGGYDFIITKFNLNGTALVASTYMGGTLNEGVNGSANLSGVRYNYSDDLRGGVVTDANNNIYFGACTASTNFPVTPGCLQSSLNGANDAVVVKFDPNLIGPVYSTYLGGAANDGVYSVALNNANQLYVTGGTQSSNFPVTPGVIHPTLQGGVDGFVGLLSANGNNLLASTYIGTSSYDQSFFVQLDNQNKVYLLGQTEGSYPVSSGVYTNPSSGQFIHCLNANLSSTFFSTVVGRGSTFPDIVPSAFLVDVCGSIYLSGWGGTLNGGNQLNSTTQGLPVTANAFMPTTDNEDFYFMVLDKDALSLQYATFFGGNLSHEHVDGGTSRFDKAGIIYQAICESCGGHDDMPTTPGVWSNQNGSSNCNNAVVKFSFSPNLVAAQLATDPGVLSGCAPFTVDFINHSVNGVNYFWSFGDGGASTQFEPTHTYTTAGTYQVRLISNNNATCNIFDTTYISVTVFPPINLSPITSPTICSQDSAKLLFNAPVGATYTWSPNQYINSISLEQPNVSPPVTFQYYINVSLNGCQKKDSVTVYVSSNDTKILLDSSHMCLDDTVKLFANQVNNTYQWSTGENTKLISVLNHGWYYLTAINNIGCISKDSIWVDSLHRVPLTSYTMAVCENQKLQLMAPIGKYQYIWNPGLYINSPFVFDPFVSPPSSTSYSLTLINGPCLSNAEYQVIVYPSPTIAVSPQFSEIIPGETVILTAQADTICSWAPGFGLTCTFCNVTLASPEVNTIYYASVTNQFGCTSVDSLKIDVIPTLYVPNSFTPNDDLINDVFKPVHSGYKSLEFYIYDRWGELIFASEDLYSGWDGTKKKVKCPMDVYVYKLVATDYKNHVLEKVGHVTLIR